ncbi:DNA-binding NarL/FixJ family response regulator [Filimonas zeae]|uniref:DNA-binding response regulator n=1 Tax=Filimonas zeae TaxID=1737353 RepID=A0A917J0A1_9BACT|nr:response regulator transcription factor [Filimonas zeae]MDR6340371.1 DNA-binding NarL/FixJ family response regulator [Filimonas zeae]GGH72428.1 DNA-binding response regulator [Filimonas zeae]
MSIKVVIFDDNKNIRNSIIMLLNTDPEFELVGTFTDAENCVEDVLACNPDVVLMDIEMPGVNGIEAVRKLRKEVPHISVIIQTVFEDEDRIFDSLKAGASGYILKSCLKDLGNAIRETVAGGSPMTPWVARKVLNMIYTSKETKREPAPQYNLTVKEKEVLTHIVNGLSYKMIAAEMTISYETVRSHVKKIYEKLHVASLTEVVAKAINQQIV